MTTKDHHISLTAYGEVPGREAWERKDQGERAATSAMPPRERQVCSKMPLPLPREQGLTMLPKIALAFWVQVSLLSWVS